MVPDWVIVGAGTRAAKIRLAPRDLVRASVAEVIQGLARPLDGIPA